MKLSKISVVASVMAVGAVPAVALAGSDRHGPPGDGKPTGVTGPSGPTGPGGGLHGSRHCKPHSVGYVAGGVVDGSSPTTPLTKTGRHKYTGTLVVDVKKTDHHASGDKGKTVSYTLNGASVHFSHGTSNPPVAGDRVQVIGKITTLNPRCDQTGFTPTVTVRQVDVHAPAKSGPTGSGGPAGSTGPTGRAAPPARKTRAAADPLTRRGRPSGPA